MNLDFLSIFHFPNMVSAVWCLVKWRKYYKMLYTLKNFVIFVGFCTTEHFPYHRIYQVSITYRKFSMQWFHLHKILHVWQLFPRLLRSALSSWSKHLSTNAFSMKQLIIGSLTIYIQDPFSATLHFLNQWAYFITSNKITEAANSQLWNFIPQVIHRMTRSLYYFTQENTAQIFHCSPHQRTNFVFPSFHSFFSSSLRFIPGLRLALN